MTDFEWLLLLGGIGLVFVLRNWWDLIRYGLDHAHADAPRAGAPALATGHALALPFPAVHPRFPRKMRRASHRPARPRPTTTR